MQVFFLHVHDKAVHIHEVIVPLAWILPLIGKKIPAFRFLHIKPGLFLHLTAHSLL